MPLQGQTHKCYIKEIPSTTRLDMPMRAQLRLCDTTERLQTQSWQYRFSPESESDMGRDRPWVGLSRRFRH